MILPDWAPGADDIVTVGAALVVLTGWLKGISRPVGRWLDKRIANATATATAGLATTLAQHTHSLEGLRRDVDDGRSESTIQHAEVSKRIDRLSERIDIHLQAHTGEHK